MTATSSARLNSRAKSTCKISMRQMGHPRGRKEALPQQKGPQWRRLFRRLQPLHPASPPVGGLRRRRLSLGYPKLQQEGSPAPTQLHSFAGHSDSVNVVGWNPHRPLQFATGSSDKRVVVWDMGRLGENTTEKTGNEILVSSRVCSSSTADIVRRLWRSAGAMNSICWPLLKKTAPCTSGGPTNASNSDHRVILSLTTPDPISQPLP